MPRGSLFCTVCPDEFHDKYGDRGDQDGYQPKKNRIFFKEYFMCLYVVKSFGIKDIIINTIFKEAKIMKKIFCIAYPNTYICGIYRILFIYFYL